MIQRRHVRRFLTTRKATLWGRAFDLGEPESLKEAEDLLMSVIMEVHEMAREDMTDTERHRESGTATEWARAMARAAEAMTPPGKAEEPAQPFSRGNGPYSVEDWQVGHTHRHEDHAARNVVAVPKFLPLPPLPLWMQRAEMWGGEE